MKLLFSMCSKRLLLIVVLGGVAVAGCGGSSDGGEGESIKLGFIGALTGEGATLGQNEQLGAEAAIKEVNAAGGVKGRMLELVVRDSEGDPPVALDAARELSADPEILGIIGPDFSSNVRAAAPVLNQAQLPWFALTPVYSPEAGPESYEFAGYNTGDETYAIGLQWAAEERGFTRIGILASADTTGEEGIASVERLAPDYGLDIAGIEQFELTATDVTAQLRALTQSDIDMLVVVVSGTPFGMVLRSVNQLGLRDELPIFGSTGTCLGNLEELIRNVEPDVYVCATQKPVPGIWEQLPDDDPQKQAIQQLIGSVGKEDLNITSALGWDVAHLFATAAGRIPQGDDLTREALRDALIAEPRYEGALATWKLTPSDHRGIPFSDLLLFRSTENGTKPVVIASGG